MTAIIHVFDDASDSVTPTTTLETLTIQEGDIVSAYTVGEQLHILHIEPDA